MKKLFTILIFLFGSLKSAEGEIYEGRSSFDEELLSQEREEVALEERAGYTKEQAMQRMAEVEAEKEKVESQVEGSPENYTKFRKKNLGESIKNMGIDNVIDHYTNLIKKFKDEDMYQDYPELMGEAHNNLFDLYKKQLEDFLGKDKKIKEVEKEMINDTETVLDIFNKLQDAYINAQENYSQFDPKLQKLIVSDMDNFLEEYYAEKEEKTTHLEKELSKDILEKPKMSKAEKKRQAKIKELKEKIEKASSIADLTKVHKEVSKLLAQKVDLDVIDLKNSLDRETLKFKIAATDAIGVHRLIESLRTKAFEVPTIIGKGYDPKGAEEFNLMAELVIKLIRKSVKEGELSDKFLDYVNLIETDNKKNQEYVAELHEKYATLFPKENIFHFEKGKVPSYESGEYERLIDIKNELEKNIAESNVFFNKITRSLIDEVKNPPDFWAKRFYKKGDKSKIKNLINAKTYFKKNDVILNSWLPTHEEFSKESSKEWSKELSKVFNVYRKDIEKRNQHYEDKKIAEYLLTDLEGVDYIWTEKIKQNERQLEELGKGSRRRKKITKIMEERKAKRDKARDIINAIHTKYPDVLGSLDIAKLSLNKKKDVEAVYALLGSNIHKDNRLLKEVNQIIGAKSSSQESGTSASLNI